MIAWRIAMRYLFSKKSHSAVNIISIVAVAGVAVATAAIVIVLSVFNGFTDVARHQLSAVDPALRVVPATGKVIADADSLCRSLEALPGVAAAVPVVEERGLAISGNTQMPVRFKGVPDDYNRVADLAKLIIDGEYTPYVYDTEAVQITPGVAIKLGIRPNITNSLGLYVPRRIGRINPANPSTAFRGDELTLTGVVQTEQAEYDADHVIVPLSVARDLLEYDTEATSIEIALAPGTNVQKERAAIADFLSKYAPSDSIASPWAKVLTREMQEEKSFRMIQIEKWVTFLMLAFILVIASFNIISTLSLLVIEKRSNMATLRALGATKGMVRRIFVWEGIFVSAVGGAIGIMLGVALALAQQYGGFIKLAGDPAQLTIHTYPVRLEATDILAVLALVAMVAIVSALSTLLFTRKEKTNY